MDLFLDRHLVAGITILGMCCDLLGGFYLASDLLTKQSADGSRPGIGLLYSLTEVFTYMAACLFIGLAVFALVITAEVTLRFPILDVLGEQRTIAFGLAYGASAGLGAGAGYGVNVNLGHRRDSAAKGKPLGRWTRVVGTLGIGLVVGGVHWIATFVTDRPDVLTDTRSAAVVGILIGLVGGLFFGLSALKWITGVGTTSETPGVAAFDPFGIVIGVTLGATFGLMAGLASVVVFGSATSAPIVVYAAQGVVVGLIMGVFIGFAQTLQAKVYRMTRKGMGLFGLGLLLLGFAIQTCQYWLVVFDVPVH